MTEPTDDERKQAEGWLVENYPPFTSGTPWKRECVVDAHAHGLAANRLRAEKAETEMVAQSEARGALNVQLGLAKVRVVKAFALLAQAKREWTPTQGPTDEWLAAVGKLIEPDEPKHPGCYKCERDKVTGVIWQFCPACMVLAAGSKKPDG